MTDQVDPIIAPYGSWKSPITADLIVMGTTRLAEIQLDGEDIYWLELRASEGGRTVLIRRTADGRVSDVSPQGFNVRTRVHEYGGGSYCVHAGVAYYTNFTDQRLYRQTPSGAPEPITPETPSGQLHYADFAFDAARHRLICVREDHRQEGHEAVNTLVALALDGSQEANSDGGRVLAQGNDFYSTPRISPDGARLAWLTWNHPNMPWDGTTLWVAEIAADGALANPRLVAGGERESIFQPEWSPDGILYFVSDRSGWWNLYRWREDRQNQDEQIEALAPMDAEFGEPQWLFGLSRYAFASANRLICTYSQQGISTLASLNTTTHELTPIAMPYTSMQSVRATGDTVVFVGELATRMGEIVRLDLASGQMEALRSMSSYTIDPAYIAVAEPIEFPTEGGLTAYALFYRPLNAEYAAPEGTLPPLRVLSHGGPTSMAPSVFNATIAYWTSRGFAVLNVNYGGSSGYGRAYRERLNGQFGIVDRDDCVNGARYLVAQGLVDGEKLAISGGSAGGYTTLCALTFRDTFKAGADHFGISDIEALARDTHKFESRYADHLIGPYPAAQELYRQRSPIHYTDRLSCPVIIFQGLEDPVVPPNQSQMMVDALRAKGLPVAYVTFAGEGHGFRKAENIKRALEGELYFYGRIFGFTPADDIAPVEIENLG
jgi:dipeptidyl aminopeptidase/acylaminoacyl peptidase